MEGLCEDCTKYETRGQLLADVEGAVVNTQSKQIYTTLIHAAESGHHNCITKRGSRRR